MPSVIQKNKSGSFWRKALIAVLYIVGSLVVAELFYRNFWQEPPKTEVVYGNHPVFHHVPKSFLVGGLGEYDMRGTRYSLDKEPGTQRLVFLGDSFTYGFTLPEQTVPYHLESLLKSRFPGMKFEVLNFGFVSYSPLIEEVVYRELVSPLKPDLVILLYDTFDPQDDVLYAKSATFDDRGVPLAVAGEDFLKVGLRRSALVRFVETSIEIIRNGWNLLPVEQRFESRIKYLTEPQTFQWVIDDSFKIVGRLGGQVQADGARFLLFQYPPPHLLQDLSEFKEFLAGWGVDHAHWIPPKSSAFAPMVLNFCAQAKLSCYDFGPKVRQMEEDLGPKGSRQDIYNNRDGHFTGKANAVFARFILEKLQETGFPTSPNPAPAP